jgi:branched-chain amino acid transport system permease protein
VIGGIGRIEGPIIGTIVFFVLRQSFADLGSLYLIMLGAVAIAVMLIAPKGLWGLIADRFGWELFPLARRLAEGKPGMRRAETGGRRPRLNRKTI